MKRHLLSFILLNIRLQFTRSLHQNSIRYSPIILSFLLNIKLQFTRSLNQLSIRNSLIILSFLLNIKLQFTRSLHQLSIRNSLIILSFLLNIKLQFTRSLHQLSIRNSLIMLSFLLNIKLRFTRSLHQFSIKNSHIKLPFVLFNIKYQSITRHLFIKAHTNKLLAKFTINSLLSIPLHFTTRCQSIKVHQLRLTMKIKEPTILFSLLQLLFMKLVRISIYSNLHLISCNRKKHPLKLRHFNNMKKNKKDSNLLRCPII